jgi:hypothetical protein
LIIVDSKRNVHQFQTWASIPRLILSAGTR